MFKAVFLTNLIFGPYFDFIPMYQYGDHILFGKAVIIGDRATDKMKALFSKGIGGASLGRGIPIAKIPVVRNNAAVIILAIAKKLDL